MADLSVVVEVVLRGLFLGMLYAVAASGLALIFGVMRVVNVAHGELMMLGGYAAYVLWSFEIVHPLMAIVLAALAVAAVGAVVQRTLVERVVTQHEMLSLLLLFGVSIVLLDAARGIFSTNLRSISYLGAPVRLLGASYPAHNLLTLVIGVAVGVSLYTFLRFTPLGKALRATAQNQELAMACGIDCGKVRMASFAIGAGLAGVAGGLIAINYSVYPSVGQVFILTMFAVVVLGGLGSVGGAFAGGAILGVAEAVATRYLTANLSILIAYVVLLGVLLIRPRGLFGSNIEGG